MSEFSDYIVYVDESGDHGLASIDKTYPVFVLAFCVFRKDEYASEVTPAVQKFKFKYFGHDMVVLHEHEIRKSEGPFTILFNGSVRNNFFEDLNQIMTDVPMTIIASFIDKEEYRKQQGADHNLYDVALGSCLERLFDFLQKHEQHSSTTHVIFEARGKKEDDELELEFRRVCARDKLPFDLVFAKKEINSCGLQVADLVARPIGRKYLNFAQPNRAFDILEKKLATDVVGIESFPK